MAKKINVAIIEVSKKDGGKFKKIIGYSGDVCVGELKFVKGCARPTENITIVVENQNIFRATKKVDGTPYEKEEYAPLCISAYERLVKLPNTDNTGIPDWDGYEDYKKGEIAPAEEDIFDNELPF